MNPTEDTLAGIIAALRDLVPEASDVEADRLVALANEHLFRMECRDSDGRPLHDARVSYYR